jgi:hypothetical protein
LSAVFGALSAFSPKHLMTFRRLSGTMPLLLTLARTIARPLLLVVLATLLIELVLPLALAAQVEPGS